MERNLIWVLFIFLSFLYMLRWYQYSRSRQEGGKLSVANLKALARSALPRYRRILRNYYLYYNRLPWRYRRKFEMRVLRFIINKRFVPRQMEEVTEEMKVLIAATAVQLTFGFKEVYLRHFHYILVYPDQFYSTTNEAYHLGEVNPKYGVIALSWKAFVQGYKNPTDGYNLGLHEMAHALELENNIPNEEYRFLNDAYFQKWREAGEAELEKIQRGEGKFWRKYAGTDKDEFFAVCVEYFFEKSLEFREQLPELYKIMTRLLQQDPIVMNRLAQKSTK